jgi:hypothetical protein
MNKQEPNVINVWGLANIGCTMENPTFQTLVAPEGLQKAEPEGNVGRPKKAGKKNLKSFIYQAYTDEETNMRLRGLYLGLLQLKWIADDTKQKTFLSIFSGDETTCRVVWTGEVNTLAELFRELVSRKQYVKLPEGESIWVMVNARFWEKEGNREFGNDRLRSTSTPTGSKETIDWLVKLMNPDMPLETLKEMMHTQR